MKCFRLNSRNVEFSRSFDQDFFSFLLVLLLKLVFKFNENSLQQLYLGNSTSRVSNILLNLISFLVLRGSKEDIVSRRLYSLLKFFLRVFSLIFYQLPLYKHLVKDLQVSLFSLSKIKPLVKILGCENKNVNSSFISRFLARKLAQKYKWSELMSSLRKELNYMTDTEKFLYGYKIQFRGRFTRRSRSESVSTGYGRVSTSTISAFIDYASSSLTLRNGSGCVKV